MRNTFAAALVAGLVALPVALADDKESAKAEAELAAQLDKIKTDTQDRLEALAKAAEKAKKPALAKIAREAGDQVRGWTFDQDKGIDFEALCAKWKLVLDDGSLSDEERAKKLDAMGQAVKGHHTRVTYVVEEVRAAEGAVILRGRVGDYTLGLQFSDSGDIDQFKSVKRTDKIVVEGEIYIGRKGDLPGIDVPRLARGR